MEWNPPGVEPTVESHPPWSGTHPFPLLIVIILESLPCSQAEEMSLDYGVDMMVTVGDWRALERLLTKFN